jgi:hypothetical protein
MYRHALLPQNGVFRFQLPNARLQPLDLHCNVFGRELLWNVLTAVDIPYVDLDENRTLDARGVRWIGQATKEGEIPFHDRRAAPQLHASVTLIVDEKETHRRVFRQPPNGYVLTVAGKIGKPEPRGAQYFEKTLRSAAVLDVGLPVGRGCRDEEAVDPREKRTQPLIDGLRKPSRPLSS